MAEKIIDIVGIDPVELYGVNNARLVRIKGYFPKLKIVARGHELKVIGEKGEISNFEKKIDIVIEFYNQYNKITEFDIEKIFLDPDLVVRQAMIGKPDDVLVFGNNGKPIKARNQSQRKIVEHCDKDDLLMAIGPAGTGKTYIAIALAVRALRNRQVRKIILTRPAVEAGERLGFLPGDYKEKLDPYLQPLYDALDDMIPSKKLADFLEDKTIQIAPLAFMRGRTLSNAFVVLDEAQNATSPQLKMFLTRMGENSQFIVTGDVTQIDLPDRRLSGLVHTQRLLKGIDGIGIVEFDGSDVIRHKLVKHIITAYEKQEKED